MTTQPSLEGSEEYNVLGEPLQTCSENPLTGFFRSGYCAAGPENAGVHLICIEVTAEFLAYSKTVGNDLSTPRPEFAFPGLVPGNRWWEMTGLCSSCSMRLMRAIRIRADRMTYRQGRAA